MKKLYSSTRSSSLVPGTSIGAYVLGRLIGQGGMATVYEATIRGIGKRVALKILHTDLARQPEMAERFINEARSASQVSHPGLISIFDCGGTEDGFLFIAMELLEGVSLEKYIQQREHLSCSESTAIGRQIASALDAVHAHGVIHRDLKPANVFLVEDQESHLGRRVKVLDFGIAKLAQSVANANRALTRAGVVMGTPDYMSPEQWRDLPNITAKADVYSLGIILFEMMVGVPPFSGSDYQLMHDHFHRKPPAPRDMAPWITTELSELIVRMLKKDPLDRPTMNEVREVLRVQAVSQSVETAPARGEKKALVPRKRDSGRVLPQGPALARPAATPAAAPAVRAVASSGRPGARDIDELLKQYDFLRPLIESPGAEDRSSLEELVTRFQASGQDSFVQYLSSQGIVSAEIARMITAVQKGYVKVDLKALISAQQLRGTLSQRDVQGQAPPPAPSSGKQSPSRSRQPTPLPYRATVAQLDPGTAIADAAASQLVAITSEHVAAPAPAPSPRFARAAAPAVAGAGLRGTPLTALPRPEAAHAGFSSATSGRHAAASARAADAALGPGTSAVRAAAPRRTAAPSRPESPSPVASHVSVSVSAPELLSAPKATPRAASIFAPTGASPPLSAFVYAFVSAAVARPAPAPVSDESAPRPAAPAVAPPAAPLQLAAAPAPSSPEPPAPREPAPSPAQSAAEPPAPAADPAPAAASDPVPAVCAAGDTDSRTELPAAPAPAPEPATAAAPELPSELLTAAEPLTPPATALPAPEPATAAAPDLPSAPAPIPAAEPLTPPAPAAPLPPPVSDAPPQAQAAAAVEPGAAPVSFVGVEKESAAPASRSAVQSPLQSGPGTTSAMDLIPISICMCICTCGDAAVCVCRCTCGLPATLDAAAAPGAAPPELETPQGLPTAAAPDARTAPHADELEVHVGAHVGPYRVLSVPIRNERHLRFDTYSEQLQRSAVMYVYPQNRLPAGPESADRFAEATQALTRLQHPGIARVLDAGTVGTRPFLVYEPAGELSLDRLLDCMGALRMQRLAHLGLLAGEALGAAAAAGLSHGELRLDCIGYRRDGSVRILGLGARGLVERLCPPAAGDAAALPDALPTATPGAWSAPEQLARDSCADTQGDMYSLGAILYAAATGHAPQTAALRSRTRHGGSQSAAQNQLEGYGVPAPIAQVIARYMAPEASERYPGWDEATRALQEAVSKSSGALRDVSSQSLLALPAEIEPEEELTFQPERVPVTAPAPEPAPGSASDSDSERAEPAPSPDEATESTPPQWLHRVARPLLPLEEERFAAEAEAPCSAAEDARNTGDTRDERFATDEVFFFRPRRDGLVRRRPLRAIATPQEKVLYSALFASVIWFLIYLLQRH